MLAWRLMKGTEQAWKRICMQAEAHDHYGQSYGRLAQLADWLGGFREGWKK